MEKYVITSGNVVITMFSEDAKNVSFEASSKHNPIKFDKIGEAMNVASKINKLIGSNSFKVVTILK